MLEIEVDDFLLGGVVDPGIFWLGAVVLVGFTEALAPVSQAGLVQPQLAAEEAEAAIEFLGPLVAPGKQSVPQVRLDPFAGREGIAKSFFLSSHISVATADMTAFLSASILSI